MRSLWLAFLVWFITSPDGAKAVEVSRGAPDDWVEEVASLPERPSDRVGSRDVEYVLLDRQVNIETEEDYTHIAMFVASEGGLQSAGRWSVSFDPIYESITMHRLQVHRMGRLIDRSETAEFRYLEQEEDAARHIYNGNVTAVTLLEDIRVGDLVEFSYTRKGRNPVFEGRYFDSQSLGWETPVQSLRLKFIGDEAGVLRHRMDGPNAPEPTEVVAEGKRVVGWQAENTAVTAYEENTPAWYSSYPWVEFSSYESWVEVVDWALPLYAAGDLPPTAALAEEVAPPADSSVGADSDERIVELLAYVQREIRYLGIELGTSSHRPHLPEETFGRRFGDCKDKSLLLVQLLRAEGFEAYPVLVDSSQGERLDHRLPSPGVFDHVIVAVVRDGNWIWLDPTMAPGAGDLLTRSAPDYGYGLVIKAGETGVRRMEQPPAAQLNTRSTEVFTIGPVGEPSRLTVETQYRGSSAISVRNNLADTSPEQTRQNYQEYYAAAYPNTRIDESPRWSMTDDGKLSVSESYTINGIWTEADSAGEWAMETQPQLIQSWLPYGLGTERTAPYALSHPAEVSLTQRLNLPSDWEVDIADVRIENPWFSYTRKISQEGKQNMTLHYQYVSRANHVAAADMPRYVEDVLEARDLTGIELSFWPEGDAVGDQSGEQEAPFAPNLLMFILSGFAFMMGLAGVFLWWRWQHQKAPPRIPGEEPDSIGGWLILPLLGALFHPFRLMQSMLTEFKFAFDQDVWVGLTTPALETYNPSLAALILAEVGGNCLLAVLSVAVFVLFLRRDLCLPRMYQTLLVFSFMLSAGDLLWGSAIEVLEAEDVGEMSVDLARQIFYMGIWIPYFSVSKRVKRTFLN